VAEQAPPPLVAEIVKKFDEAKGSHDAFVRSYERNERAYKGILDAASSAARWRHKLHPPYAFNLLETVVANHVEMGLSFQVRPAPHVNESLDEAMRLLAQAEACEDLLRHEHRVDEMDFKQRPLYLTAGIGGRGVGKCYWNLTEGAVRRQGVKIVDVTDDDGNPILKVPTVQTIVEDGVLRDHSTTEIVDPRDFIIHESARSLQPWEPGGAQHVFHRCWYSFEQLKMMEASGYLQNVDQLKEKQDQSSEYRYREGTVYEPNKRKDLIEVLEYWCMKNGAVYRSLVGGRSVLLRDEEESPFWHGGYPFFICSSMPQPFSTIGTSQIELIAELQSMLWELANHRLDNVELINNFITLIRSDVDDPDAFEWYPGARWPVDSTDQVEILQPPYQLAEVTLQAEQFVKGDLQNVTSATPFAGGTDTQSVDQKTATGASIVMNAAQQQLQAKKYYAQQGLKQEAQMRLKNCQQFIDDNKLVHIIGPDGRMAFRELSPLDIQGDYICELEAMGESDMRQERRAEAMQLTQVLLQSAPLAAAAGVPLNIEEVLKWALKRWGLEDGDRFFSAQPASLGAIGQGSPPQQSGGTTGVPAVGPNIGITSAAAVDAASPSAAGGISGSPITALARALAMGGAR
jgi:hypothetical protein